MHKRLQRSSLPSRSSDRNKKKRGHVHPIGRDLDASDLSKRDTIMPDNELIRYIEQLSLPGIDYPRLSNRGVTNLPDTFVFSHLDYLSIMYPYPSQGSTGKYVRLPVPDDLFTVVDTGSGIKNWRQSATMSPGGRFYWNDAEADKGCYVVLAGDDLALIRARLRLSDGELLDRLAFNATNFTRADFCINITAGSAIDTRKEFEAGRKKTRVRSAWEPDHFAGGNGKTIYFGSSNSDKLLRVYDKARELKLFADIVLTRIELQTRYDVADSFVRAMRKNTVVDVGKTAIRKFCDFPKLGWYQDALSGAQDVPMQLIPRKETDFMRWLNEQVGPAIKKRVEKGESTPEIRDWLHAMWEILRVG